MAWHTDYAFHVLLYVPYFMSSYSSGLCQLFYATLTIFYSGLIMEKIGLVQRLKKMIH